MPRLQWDTKSCKIRLCGVCKSAWVCGAYMYVKKLNLSNLNRDFEQMSAYKTREDTLVAKGLIHQQIKASYTSSSSPHTLVQASVPSYQYLSRYRQERSGLCFTRALKQSDMTVSSQATHVASVGSVLNYLQLLLAKVEPRRGVQKKLGKRDQRQNHLHSLTQRQHRQGAGVRGE